MTSSLRNVIRWGFIVVANLFVLAAIFSVSALNYGIPAAYKLPIAMLGSGCVAVWCLYTLLWHWKELAGREVLARIVAGLFGVFVAAHVLYVWRYESDEPIFVTVKPDFSLDLGGGDVVTSSHLIAAVETATRGNHKEPIIVLPTRSVGRHYYLMLGELLGSAGYVNYRLSASAIRHSPRRNHTFWTSFQS
jgi:hypothetical protein